MADSEPVDIGRINEQLKKLSLVEDQINRQLQGREFRKRLFENPVEVLREEGVVLPEDRAQAVTDLFTSAKVPEDADIRVGSEAGAIGISIGIRF